MDGSCGRRERKKVRHPWQTGAAVAAAARHDLIGIMNLLLQHSTPMNDIPHSHHQIREFAIFSEDG